MDARLLEKISAETAQNLRPYIREVGKKKSLTIKHSDITNNWLADLIIYRKSTADRFIKDVLVNSGIEDSVLNNLQIRYTDLPSISTIRSLRSDLVGQNRSFEGITRRVSEVWSKATDAVFECSNCSTRTRVQQDGITLPDSKCSFCGKVAKWKVIPDAGKFIDYQQITVQEYPESVRSGEQPKSIVVAVTGDICGVIIPGNRVTVCGTLKLKQIKSDKDLLFEQYVDGSSITLKDQNYDNVIISDSDLKQIEKVSKSENIIELISASIAPTIYGNEDVKKGITLQLFGGVPKVIEQTKLRGDVHILLIGDPGIAKSVIMKYVVDISPRGIFTHGYSASKAGLTATAVKEDDRWVLDAGALVLADMGICAVDELDKMGDIDREALHGAMEQQEIDIAKAGIIAKLYTRCALLAAANPKLGRFDLTAPLPQQFDLAPTLLSRFDLIYPLTDVPEKERDSRIADHILSTHKIKKAEPPLSVEFLRKYIAHAKSIDPVLTDGASGVIKEYYTKVRGLANNMQTVPITARSLEGLIRLSEAAARMRLSKEVTPDDAMLVIGIVDGCLKQIAYDAQTNTWDIDRIASKYPKKVRDIFGKINDAIICLGDEKKSAKVSSVTQFMFERYGIGEQEVLKAIELLKENRTIFTPREGLIKIL